MPSAQTIHIGHSTSRAPIQRPLRILGYHSDTRAWGTEARWNTQESIMSPAESSPVAGDRHSEDAGQSARKRARPLTSGQEAVFFGITFAVAVAFQLAVILKVANVIAW